MSSGQFMLFRRDAAKNEVACSNVHYRIVRLRDNAIVHSGVTDEKGLTKKFIGEPAKGRAADPYALPSITSYDMSTPLLASNVERYALKVFDHDINQWVDPDLLADKSASSIPWVELQIKYENSVVLSAKSIDDGSLKYCRLRLRPQHKFRLLAGKSGNPIKGVPFIGYTKDPKGHSVSAKDAAGKAIKGNTDRYGCTHRIDSDDVIWVRFNLPGSTATVVSELNLPSVVGQRLQCVDVRVKTQAASTAQGDGAIANISGKVSAPAMLNAADEELVLLTSDGWKDFEKVSGLVENTFSGIHRARLNLDKALQERDAESIKKAELALDKAEDQVAEMLNKDFAKKADLVELVTFESYDKGKGRNGGDPSLSRMGLRRRYIPRKKYEEYKSKRLLGMPYKLDMSRSSKAKLNEASRTRKASHEDSTTSGDKGFDAKKFKESLAKVGYEIKKKASVQSDTAVWDFIELGGNHFADTVEKNPNWSVETSAQWLRCVGGAGASSELSWDPKSMRLKAQASASAEGKIVLFEGKYSHKWTHKWAQKYGDFDLGFIVFQFTCDLYGFVGAKAGVTGAVGVAFDGKKARIDPRPRDRGDRLSDRYDPRVGAPVADMGDPPRADGTPSPRVVPAALNEKPPKDLNGMSVQAEVFAGAEIGLSPAGEFQWLPPPPAPGKAATPATIASLTLDVAGSAGAGASAQLHIYYANGRFRMKVSARLCWGLGAKGALDFVVNAGVLQEFAKWMYYQLLHAKTKQLVFMAAAAFRAYSQLLYMLILEGTGLKGSEVEAWLQDTAQGITNTFNQYMSDLERATDRKKIIDNINKKPEWLVYATPETRGMLLYALTRHDWAAHWLDMPKVQFLSAEVHYLDAHKDAILNVFRCVRQVDEWTNTLQHMTIDGSRLTKEAARKIDPKVNLKTDQEVMGWAEGNIMRFLNYGRNLVGDLKGDVFDFLNANPGWRPDDVGNSYLQDYLEHRQGLLGVFPKGFHISWLDRLPGEQLLALDGQTAIAYGDMDPTYQWNGDDVQYGPLSEQGKTALA